MIYSFYFLKKQLDEGPDLVAAFECFDERDEGKIDAGELRYWLSEVGDRMQDEEVGRASLTLLWKILLTILSSD